MELNFTNTKMRDRKIMPTIVSVFVLFFWAPCAKAQETVLPAGGNASGDSGYSSYSVGQTFYQTHSDSGGSMAEGVQQPYEIWIYTSVEEAEGITLSVYPNPTKDFLNLELEMVDIAGFVYQLFDFNGRLLAYGNITDTRTLVDMGGVEPAVYFLRVTRGQKELRTFKIIKN